MEPGLSAFKFGLIACSTSAEDEANGCASILHFCGYETEPTQVDIEQLVVELNTDPEFGLVGRVGKDVFIMRASPEVCAHYLGTPS